MSIQMTTGIVVNPAIKSSFFPESEKGIKKYRHIIEKIFNTSGPFEYETYLDFLVGEVLGPKFREHCRKYYFEDGRQIQKLYKKSQIDGFDDFLCLTLETCCDGATEPFDGFIDKLRDCAGTEKGYRDKKISPLVLPQTQQQTVLSSLQEKKISPSSGAIELGVLVKTEDAIDNFEDALEMIFNEGVPFEYRTLLDFVVGEVSGPEYREKCFDYYQEKGKKLNEIYSARRLKSIDDTLADIIMQCCENADELSDRLLGFLRIYAGTSKKYENNGTDGHHLVSNSQSTVILAKKQATSLEEINDNKSPDPPVAVHPKWERKENILNSYAQTTRSQLAHEANIVDVSLSRIETGCKVLQNGHGGIYMKVFTFEERNADGGCVARKVRIATYRKDQNNELQGLEQCTLSPNKALEVIEFIYSWFGEDHRKLLKSAIGEIDCDGFIFKNES